MRSQALWMAMLCCTASAWGAGGQILTPAEQEVVRVSELRQAAFSNRDKATYGRYTDDTFLGVNDVGAVLTKQGIIDEVFSMPPIYESQSGHGDLRVRLHGDTAVLSFIAVQKEDFEGTPAVKQTRRTEIYQKHGADWRAIASHLTVLPENHSRPIEVPGQRLEDFVGVYLMRPGLTDTVMIEGGRLWNQTTGAAKTEDFPYGKDTFFTRDDLGMVTFTRDAVGKVTGYVYRSCEGIELPARRIK